MKPSHDSNLPTSTGNSSHRFGGMISPEALISLVESTAPFLNEIQEEDLPPSSRSSIMYEGSHPLGFVRILREAPRLYECERPDKQELIDYFALCLACHHATVATYVPTDVDSKIRGTLWDSSNDPEVLRTMFKLSLEAMTWGVKGISSRYTEMAKVGPVSGHNGEMLGVLAGALGAFIRNKMSEQIEEVTSAIDAELAREAKEWNFTLDLVYRGKGFERQLLAIAGSLTHNIGDLDQGIGYWPKTPEYEPFRTRFADYNHAHAAAYDGAYSRCLTIYKKLMASEGHRHYPLREVKALRQSPELLLPLGPYLDDWGGVIARSKTLADEDRRDVLSQLLQGCKKIAGQTGYYRAISGMAEQMGGRFAKLCDNLPKTSRVLLKDRKVISHLQTSKASFEGSMAKQIRESLRG